MILRRFTARLKSGPRFGIRPEADSTERFSHVDICLLHWSDGDCR